MDAKRKKKNVQQPEIRKKFFPVSVENIYNLTPEEIQILINELTTHQIELAAQNEEIQQAQQELQKARDKYRELYDTVPVGYFTIDENSFILEANATAVKMLSTTRSLLLGCRFTHFIPSTQKSQDIFDLHTRKVFQSAERLEYDLEMQRKDETRFFAHLQTSPVLNNKNQVSQLRIAATDITESKVAEAALKESEERFRAIAETSPVGIGVVGTPQGEFLFVNPAYEKAFGYAPGELLGHRTPDIYWDISERERILGMLKQNGNVADYEVKLRRKDGTTFWSMASARPITFGGQPALLGAFFDISDRKKAEEALAVSEQKYRNLFNNMTEMFVLGEVVLDNRGEPYDLRYIEVNPAWERWTGIPRTKAICKTYREVNPDTLPSVVEVCGKAALTGDPGTLEIYSPYTKTWISAYAYSPSKGRFAAIITDITERKRAEEVLAKAKDELEIRVKERTAQLAESEEKYRKVVENANEVITVAQDGIIKFLNGKVLALTGYLPEELVSKPFLGIIHPDDRELVMERHRRRIMDEAVPSTYEFRVVRKDGSIRWAQMNAAKITWEKRPAVLAMFSDITERKLMEQELKDYAQKIIRVQEEERKRIAYELHDDTAQYLSILKLQLDALLQSGEIQSPEILEKLQYLERDAGRAVDDVRRFSHELRPGVLEHLGLQAALEQIAEDINKLKLFNIEVHVEGEEPTLTEEIKLGFFRIAQEALNNIRKHAKATTAIINLQFEEKQILMTVRDDGVGFDLWIGKTQSGLKGNLGLMSMQERAKLIRANLDIESKPSKGTTVSVEIAL